MPRAVVEQAIDRSRRRMGVQTLDLLQFHWWDYADASYLDALRHLADLQADGRIRHLALTNFDTEHLRIIRDAGIQIVSNQVQYSLIDQRPEVQMVPFCQEHGITLLDLRHRLRRPAVREVPGTTRAGPARTDHGLAPEVQADDRRLGRLGPVPGAAGGAGRIAAEAQGQHRQRRGAVDPGSAGGCRRDRRLPAGRVGAPGGQPTGVQPPADDEDRGRIEAVTRKGRNLFQRIGDCGDEYRG